MNCLYITLFFNIVTGIIQTFIKSWNQLLYPRVVEVFRLPFEPRHYFFLHLIIIVELQECGEKCTFHLQSQWSPETHLLPERSTRETSARKLRWEIVWRNVPSRLAGLWISAAISNTFHSKPVLPLSNEYGSQVKAQVQWQCCHNKHKNFLYMPTGDVSLLSGHASYSCLGVVVCLSCV